MGAKGKGKHYSQEDKVHRQATWLSANVFPDRPIDADAIAAMQGLGFSRAMELFNEIEGKADQVRNPSGFLKNAARREGLGPPPDSPESKPKASTGTKGKGRGNEFGKVHRRITWLNKNIFTGNPIDERATESIREADVEVSLNILREMEEKADGINNPSSFLYATVKREGGFGGGGIAVRTEAPPKAGGKGSASSRAGSSQTNAGHEKVEKRASWLNDFVFTAMPIDEEAVAAMKGLGVARAMELFKEIEEKSDQVRNPSGYLKKAAMREGFGPPEDSNSNHNSSSNSHSKGKRKEGGSGAHQLHRKATWLNWHKFASNPIDDQCIATLQGVDDVERAFEILRELEGKAAEVKNPSAYIISLIHKDASGVSHGVKRNLPPPPPRSGAAKQEVPWKRARAGGTS